MTQQSSVELVEELRRQVEKINNKQAENAELLAKLDAAQDQLSALEAQATSPDGAVTVAAGSGGIVRSVELTATAMRADAATLSAAINATIEQAISVATRRQLEIVHGATGRDFEPEQILGPQAKFANYGLPAEQAEDVERRADDVGEYFSVFDKER